MKCNVTITVVGKIMKYETCGMPKILIRIHHWTDLLESSGVTKFKSETDFRNKVMNSWQEFHYLRV